MHSYLTVDDCIEKKAKDARTCVIKRKIYFENYQNVLENDGNTLRKQQRFISEKKTSVY